MKKIKFQFNGMTFQLPANSVQTSTYGDKDQYIYMGAKHTASVIKQYVKQKFGKQITVWSTSDVYSGGSSVRINICSKNGSPASHEIYQDIQNFAYNFKAGSFNGMYDIYEYRSDKPSTDNGTRMDYFPSYIFVENKPKWGTVEYWVKEWNDFDLDKYDERFRNKHNITGDPWTDFLNFNREFFGKGVEVKLTSYVSNLQKELWA